MPTAQPSLALGLEKPPQVGPGRDEPPFWIRRVSLRASSETEIREIVLTRGVNVIWSPDHPPETVGGRPPGHCAGKSLLCGLVRYVLGAAHYGTRPVEAAFAGKFTDGGIGIEARLQGRSVTLFRPFRAGARTRIGECETIGDLLSARVMHRTTSTPGEYFHPLVAPFSDGEADPGQLWRASLGWMIRDQGANFAGHLAWAADAQVNGGDEVRRRLARRLLGFVSPDEIVADAELKTQADEKSRIKRRRENRSRVAEDLRQRLAEQLGVPLSEALPGPLTVERLRTALELQRQERHDERDEELRQRAADLRRQHQRAVENLAVAQQRLKEADGLVELARDRLGVCNGEKAKLNVAELEHRLGKSCPICQVPITRAMAEGCGFPGVFMDLEDLARAARDVAARHKAAENGLREAENRADELRSHVRELIATERSRNDEADAAEAAERAHLKALRDWTYTLRRWGDEIDRLAALVAEDTRAHDDLRTCDRETVAARRRQAEAREEAAKRHLRLCDLFNQVARALLGPTASGTIDMATLQPHLQADGEVSSDEINALRTVAFDYAALLFTVEGNGALPGLLVHDSPRPSDLAQALYHRLFEVTAGFEALGTPPPFQYIVTTTTEPPAHLWNSHVRLKLDGSIAAERLLRCDF
jgi:hypothetical protein